MIYPYKHLSSTLFVDIETVHAYQSFEELPERMQPLWARKASRILNKEDLTEEDLSNAYESKAGIFAEFGKIVCISCGYLSDGNLRVKAIKDHDEKALLNEFANLLISHFDDPGGYYLCGHNIKEFDIPYICRRMVVHGIYMPNMLDIAGKKPWQTQHLIDTMDLWRFGDYKNYTSLNLLTATLDIPSPKDDIDGSMVSSVYWNDDDLDRIATYCNKDVVTVAQVMMRYCDKPLLEEDQVIFVDG